MRIFNKFKRLFSKQYPPRIMEIFPNIADGTSHFRGAGPFGALKGVSHAVGNHVDWSTLSFCDGLFMQRPWGDPFHLAAEITQWNLRPIWIDYDDNLFRIPMWNHFSKEYKMEWIPKYISLLGKAEVISASTQSLANRLKQYAKHVVVIPNAVDDRLFKPPYKQGTQDVVFWRGGSSTHRQDVASVSRELARVMKKYKGKWRLVMMGDDAREMDGLGIDVEKPGANADIVQYFHRVRAFGPKIMIAPLLPCEFNRSKSRNAYLESTVFGSVLIAPDSPEYRLPGVQLYNYPEDFERVLDNCLSGKVNLKVEWEKANKFVMKEGLLSHVNKKRHKIIKQLMITEIRIVK